MLILLIFTVVICLVCYSLFSLPKETKWENPDHTWYGSTWSRWMVSRNRLNLFAYSRNKKNRPLPLDNSERLGDGSGDKLCNTLVVQDAHAAGATQKYPFVVGISKPVKSEENVVIAGWCEPPVDAGRDTTVLRADRGSYTPVKTFVDTSIPSRMKRLENQADMVLVSSLARAKNESWQKPIGASSEKPAIQHIRGVKRRLD